MCYSGDTFRYQISVLKFSRITIEVSMVYERLKASFDFGNFRNTEISTFLTTQLSRGHPIQNALFMSSTFSCCGLEWSLKKD